MASSSSSTFYQNLPGKSVKEIMAELMERHPGIDESEAAIRALLLSDLKFDDHEQESPASSSKAETAFESEEESDVTTTTTDDDDGLEDIDIDTWDCATSDEDEPSDILPGGALKLPRVPVTMSTITSATPSAHAAPLSSQGSSSEEPIPLSTLSSNPTTGEFQQHVESMKLTYHALAVMFVIMESWAAAHRNIHSPPGPHYRYIPLGQANPLPSPPSLIQCILGNVGFATPLLPQALLQHTFGLSFPDLTTPPPPMPELFPITPLDWNYPMPYIQPTQNAATIEPGATPDWVRQSQIRAVLQHVGPTPQSIDMSWIARPMPGAVPGERKRRVTRDIKPLPKRAYTSGNMTPVGGRSVRTATVMASLAQTAVDVGSAIVTGVKRLRVELGEGGLGRWKRRREI